MKNDKIIERQVCTYNAPLIALPNPDDHSNAWKIVQGNCHHWDCPRCGVKMAKLHYGQMVEGAKRLGRDNKLYFFTITSKGSDIGLKRAQDEYYLYTNRLLSAMRARAKKQEMLWCYVQVTERQKRGHPHSHFIMTFIPNDISMKRRYRIASISGEKRRIYYDTLRSDWLEKRLHSAGLGNQYFIEEINNPEAMSTYLAKYLFKDTFLTQYPEKWKRIRYSRNWYKMEKESNPEAFPLLDFRDWQKLTHITGLIMIQSGEEYVYERALAALRGSDMLISYRDKSQD